MHRLHMRSGGPADVRARVLCPQSDVPPPGARFVREFDGVHGLRRRRVPDGRRGSLVRAPLPETRRAAGAPSGPSRAVRIATLGAALFLLLAILSMPGPGEGATPIPIAVLPLPSLAAFERGEYRARDARTGADLWRTQWTVKEDARDGYRAFHVEETGRGRRDTDRPTAWTVRMELTLSRQAGRLSSAREIRDASGNLVKTQRREFDYAAGKGSVAVTDARAGGTNSTTFPLTADAIGIEMLPTELRALPDVEAPEIRFQLVTGEGKILPMTARSSAGSG